MKQRRPQRDHGDVNINANLRSNKGIGVINFSKSRMGEC